MIYHSEKPLLIPNSTIRESTPIDAEKLGQDVVALEDFFRQGLGISSGNDGDGDIEEIAGENAVDQEMVEEDLSTIKNTNALDALKWVDQFILETRRKGGCQTEESVLKQWRVCAPLHILQLLLSSPLSELDCDRYQCRNYY